MINSQVSFKIKNLSQISRLSQRRKNSSEKISKIMDSPSYSTDGSSSGYTSHGKNDEGNKNLIQTPVKSKQEKSFFSEFRRKVIKNISDASTVQTKWRMDQTPQQDTIQQSRVLFAYGRDIGKKLSYQQPPTTPSFPLSLPCTPTILKSPCPQTHLLSLPLPLLPPLSPCSLLVSLHHPQNSFTLCLALPCILQIYHKIKGKGNVKGQGQGRGQGKQGKQREQGKQRGQKMVGNECIDENEGNEGGQTNFYVGEPFEYTLGELVGRGVSKQHIHIVVIYIKEGVERLWEMGYDFFQIQGIENNIFYVHGQFKFLPIFQKGKQYKHKSKEALLKEIQDYLLSLFQQ